MKLYTILLLFFFACHSTKKNSETAQAKTEASHLTISFISKGSGIDSKAFSEIKKMMEEFKKCEVSYNIVNWGREGEKDICIQSNEQKCLDQLEKKVTDKFNNNEKIQIKKGELCKQK